jgi:hypothetical protein
MKKLWIATSLAAALILPSQPAQAATTIVGVLSPITVALDLRSVVLTPPVTNSPGAWSVTVNDPTIATANGLTLTLLKAGSTGITFTIAASGEYGSVSRSTQLYVQPGTPTIGIFANASISLGQNTFRLTPPTSNSTGTWSYTSSDTKLATLAGDLVTVYDAGSVTITATQAANAQWKSASTTMVLTIVALTPILGTFTDITVTLDSVASVNLITPTSTSSGAWTLTSSNPAVASISNLSLIPRGIGKTIITATQARFGNYKSISTTMTVTVLAAPPTLTAGSFVDNKIALTPGGTNTLTLPAPTSNSTGTWIYTSSDLTVATVSGAVVTALKPGTTKITATQNPAGKYGFSQPLSINLVVNGTPTYPKIADFERLVGDLDYTFQFPVSSSGGAWSISSGDTNVVTIQGNLLKFVGAGTSLITIRQAPSEYWLEGVASFTIRVIGQTPTVGTLDLLEVGVGQNLDFSSIKAPLSQSAGAWEYASLDTKIAQVINGAFVGIAPGQALITATQKPSGKYGQSKVVQSTITVKVVANIAEFPALKFALGSTAPQIKIPNSPSAGIWSFASSDPSIVDLINGTLLARKVGTATITATQSASSLYAQVQRRFAVEILPAAVVKPVPASNPKATITISKGAITIKVTNSGNSQVAAYIDGKKAKIGKNTVKPGVRLVKINVGGKRILFKRYAIR